MRDLIVIEKGSSILIGRAPWALEWEYIGEGNCDDYNPEDKEDRRLLRASLTFFEKECAKGSYCTDAQVGTSIEELKKASAELFEKLADDIPTIGEDGKVYFNHRVMEEWTWRSYPAIAEASHGGEAGSDRAGEEVG